MDDMADNKSDISVSSTTKRISKKTIYEDQNYDPSNDQTQMSIGSLPQIQIKHSFGPFIC
jgi:hypothetical protein